MILRNEIHLILQQEFGLNIPSKVVDELTALSNRFLVDVETRRGASIKALEAASKLPLTEENHVIEAAVKYRKFLLDLE